MRKIMFLLSIIFMFLTFVGAGAVLLNKGQMNAGYSVVPMVLSLACMALYRNKK